MLFIYPGYVLVSVKASVYTNVSPFSGVALTADTKLHRNPSEGGVHSMALALPPSQARYTMEMVIFYMFTLSVSNSNPISLINLRQEASRTSASVSDIHRHAGAAERSHAPSSALVHCIAFLQLHDFMVCLHSPVRRLQIW